MKRPVSPTRSPTVAATLLLALVLAGCSGEKPEKLVASAREYMAKNDSKAAIIQLKNALQKDVTLADARYLLGVALLRTGDAAGSEAELRKALSYKHPEDQVLPVLAESMLAQRQYRKLTDEFGKAALSQPAAQASLQMSVSAAYSAQGKAEQAREALQAALAADPSNAQALLLEAREKATARDFDGALAQLDSILANAPTSHEAWNLKGDVYWYGKGQPAEALAAYRKSVEVKADFVNGHVAILTTLVAQNSLDDASKQLELLRKVAANGLSTKYFETLLAYLKKDFKLAKSLLPQLLVLAPENVRSLQLAGEIELQANSLVQAESLLAKAVQLAPGATRARRLLVATYLRSGQPAKALATIKPMLQGDKVDAATNGLAGEVYLQNGDPKQAEAYFAKAAKQDPKNARARTALALTHLAGGSDESALGELQGIALSDASSTADLALISAHLRRREFDKALKAIDGLEKKQPDKPQAANLRGQTLLAKKDPAGARKSFERALAINPEFFPAVASLALMDMADKKPDEARQRFEALLKKNPKNPQALLALAELRARSGGPKADVAELIGRAISANPTEKLPRLLLVDYHLRNRDLKPALSAAQDAVAAIPDNPELLDALGRAQQASGDANQALLTFGKLAGMQPESPLPQMRLANAQMAADNKTAAAASLRKALALKPDLLDAQRGLMMLAVDAKNYPEALAVARSVQKQRPKETIGYQFEGDVAAVQKKWDLAVDAYRLGLKQGPSAELAMKIHTALGSAGKTADAESFGATWVKDHPKDGEFRLYLGDQASVRQDFAGAEKWYAAVVQMQPANAAALNNLAWVSGKLQKDGAIGYAEKAIALDPNQPAYMDTLAMLLSDKNDYAKALEWQNKVVALQPLVGVFRLNLAKIHIKAGKKDLARKELDAVAKLGDKFRGQAEVASLLKNL